MIYSYIIPIIITSIFVTSCTQNAVPTNTSTGITNSGGTTQKGTGLMPTGGKQKALDTSHAIKSYTGISYASDSPTQKLDIYLPSGTGAFPVIIAIHGWGFKMGSRTGWDLSSMFTWLDRGYAIVSVDYRLSGEAKYPGAIDDIQSAIKYIKQNANTYNLDPDRIVLWGASAGWHLAALAGTKWQKSENTHVQAVVDWFGPIDFALMDEQFRALGVTPKMWATNAATSAESEYLGYTIGTPEAQSLTKEASPETYITSDDPVFYIQHGTADTNIPWTQSENFAKKLTAVLGTDKVVFEKLEWAGHGWTLFDSEENLEKIFEFLKSSISQ